MRPMKNLVILISGRGSNLRAIAEAVQHEHWNCRIAAVISNKANAPGLQFAAAKNISTEIVASAAFASRESFDAALQNIIDRYSPDLIVLAGFMRILTTSFVEHYRGRMVNIHPSLLPSFPGLATHRQALAAGVKIHGATVHFVTPDLDHGPIIAQAAVPVLAGDTEETLRERVLLQEHQIYPQAIRWFIDDRLTIVGDLVQHRDDAP